MQDRSGSRLDRWVGDGDSLGEAGVEALAAQGVPVDRAPVDKDESDTELAVRAALDRRPAAIAILGALGGPRLDHALANLALLALPELRGVDVRLISAEARVRLVYPGSVELDGHVDDLVTLLPVGTDAIAVTTGGPRVPTPGRDLVPRSLARLVEPTHGGPAPSSSSRPVVCSWWRPLLRSRR